MNFFYLIAYNNNNQQKWGKGIMTLDNMIINTNFKLAV